MRCRHSTICLMTLLSGTASFALHADEPSPWEKPRSLGEFRKLLDHSPFSLPTAEERSPLAERFAITGIITVGNEEEIFVFDRNDQSRSLLTTKPNEKNMSLVSVIREEGASTPKASIRVGNESGTIAFMEASKQPQAPPPAPGPPAAAHVVGPAQGQQAVQPPGLPPLPQLPTSAPGRRIIRRPVVAPPQ